AIAWLEFAKFPAEQLQVNVERVEWIADFVCDAGSEQGEGVQAFGLQRLFSLKPGAGEIANQHHIAQGCTWMTFVVDGCEIEIKKAVLRIEHLKIAADRPAGFAKCLAIQSTDLRRELLAD